MSRRVLIVDPDAQSAKLCAVVLSAGGWRTQLAFGGAEACRIVSEERFDLVLVDLLSPPGGLSIARAIRADPIARVTPIIAISTLNGTAREEAAREAGCTGFVTKPIDVKRFATQIETMLGARPRTGE